MPSYTIKVPNNDDGEDLGEYEANFLPRVGDRFTLWHPRVNGGKDGRYSPFCGVVSAVDHEANFDPEKGDVETTVWLVEEHAAPKLYCNCSEEERSRFGVDEGGDCGSCGHARRT